jgi:iron complex outermembrane receptor protein
MRRNKWIEGRRRSVAVAMCLGLPVQYGIAQEAAPATATADAGAADVAQDAGAVVATRTPGQLQVVTVSAERRRENARNVPVSASIIADDTLAAMNTGGQDLQMLAARVPSLNVESSFGRSYPRFYIRGYGNTDFHQNASQPVSLVYDEVVLESPVLKGFPAFDLERIEVLRGPQGTQFGRNTPAGVIRFDSVQPNWTKGGYLTVSDATHNTANLEGALNLPIDDKLAARISVMEQHRDHWIANPAKGDDKAYGGYDDKAVRAQLLYKDADRFSALANLHGRQLTGSASVFRANIIEKGTNALVPGFDIASAPTDAQNGQHLENYGGSLRLRWRIDGVTLHSVTAYETVRIFSRGDIDGGVGAVFAPPSGPGVIPFPVESADATTGHRQFTQEFRAEVSPYAGLRGQAGVFYFNERYRIDSLSYDTLGGGALTADIVSHQRNEAFAVFASGSYDVNDRINVRGGLRWTHDKKSLDTLAADKPDGSSDVDASNGLATSTSASKVNGDLSATYKLDDRTNVYARVATGFRGATIQPAATFNPMSVAAPETITSYEVGIKTGSADRRARLSADLYDYRVKGQQLTAVGGTANGARLLNAERTVGRGAEMDVEAYLTDDLLLTAGASYNFTSLRDPTIAVGACAACTVLDPVTEVGGTRLARIDGNPLPQAPRWTANLTLRYTHPVANGELFAFTDWSYRSAVNFFLYQSREFTGKPLLTGGARIGYRWHQDRYEVALFGRNITNRVQVVGAIDFNNLTGFVNDFNPRIFGVQLSARF